MVKRGAISERFDAVFHSASNRLEIIQKTIYPILKLSEVVNLQRGRFSHRPRNEPKFFDGDIPFIQTGDIVKASNGGGQIQFSQTLNDLGLTVSKLFQPDVLVITIAANIGDTAILDYPACFPDSLVAITPKNEQINIYYLNVYFKYLKNYLNNLAPQSAQKNLNLQQLSPTPVIVPPLEIQAKIVNIYNQAQETKHQKEAEAKALLESIDAYLLEKLGIILPEKVESKLTFFTRFKGLQGERFDPFYHQTYFQHLINAINESKYKVYKLGDEIKEINYGASFSNEYVENGVPLLRIKDLRRNEIIIDKIVYLPESARNLLGNSFVKTNDFLISRSGTIGVVSIVPKHIDGFAFGSFMIKFNLKENSLLDRNFLSYYLNCKLLIELIEREKIGAVQGNITIPIIKSILVPIPPLPIQEEIADHITNIRQQAKTLQNEAKTAIEEAKRTVETMILG